MAKKKKQKSPQQRPSETAVAPAAEKSPATVSMLRAKIVEILRRPTLLLAWICVGLVLFSAAVAYRFRNNWEMGAVREPTGMILWSAIALTLFASYWRERRRTQSGS